MKQPGRSTIKRTVLFVAILPVTIVTLVLIILFSISQTRALEESLIERGIAISRQLAPASEYGVFSGNQGILDNLIEAVKKEADIRSIRIRNTSGKVLAQAGPEAFPSKQLDSYALKLVYCSSDNSESRIFQAPIFQTEFSANNTPDLNIEDSDSSLAEFKPTKHIIGWATVELSMQHTRAYQINTWLTTTTAAVLLLILSGILAIRMGRKITEPIILLRDAVHEIENGNLETEVHTGVSGELLSLEMGINAMTKTLRIAKANLEDRIEEATSNLRNTLSVLEQRNTDLDNARLEAEAANETKSEFLATISHEIRTPLNGIQGFLMLLDKTPLNTAQREYTDKIEISTSTLLSLINDILDFSKLNASMLNIRLSEFNVRELIDECIDVSVPTAHQKELEIYVVIDSNVPTCVTGGAERISQVIKNLVTNAVKFTSTGHINVHAAYTHDDDNNHTISIAVSDTGIGISEQDQKRLFQPFSQIETGMDRSYEGTGLGLVITKSLVELMGGKIEVQSEPGIGSCFSFELPIKPCQTQHVDKTRKSILQNKNIFIYSVDGNTVNSLTQMLKHWDIKTDICITNSDISDIFDRRYDAIIIDGVEDSNKIAKLFQSATQNNRSNQSLPCFILINPITPLLNNNLAHLSHMFTYRVSRPVHAKEIADILCREFTGINCDQSAEKLPLHTTQQFATPAALKVLVADDNLINRQFLTTWLLQIDASVDQARDGNEAIDLCKYNHYDLILMDLHMPGLDGIEAATWIRNNDNQSKKSPIVAITADATGRAKQLIKDSEISDYILKPVAEDTLLQIIAKWCQKFSYPTQQSATELNDDVANLSEGIAIVNRDKGLQLASGNEKLWHWSLQTLTERLQNQQEQMEQQVNSGHFEELSKLAHKIIGAASYCAADALLDAATQLELVAKTGNLVETQRAFEKLSIEITRLKQWMQQSNQMKRDT